MKNTDVVVVGARVCGIFLGLSALNSLPALAYSIQYAPLPYFIYSLVIFLIWLAIVLLLFFAPMKVARKLLPKNDSEDVPSDWKIEEIERTAFSVLGMFFTILAITQFASMLSSIQLVSTGYKDEFRIPFSLANFSSPAIQLGCGLWLLFGPKGLHRTLKYARRAGTER